MNAEMLNSLETSSARKTKGNITMLQVDDLCADLVHLGIVPIDDTVDLGDISDDSHDIHAEVEHQEVPVDMVLDMEGIGVDLRSWIDHNRLTVAQSMLYDLDSRNGFLDGITKALESGSDVRQGRLVVL